MKNIKLVFFALVIMSCPIARGQNNNIPSDKIIQYSMIEYWTNSANRELYESAFKYRIKEQTNNYAQKEKIFFSISAVCQDTTFVGNVYNISYRDQDHLGKLRLFIGTNLMFSGKAGQINRENINYLKNQRKDYPSKFDPLEGLLVVASYGLVPINCKN